MAENLIKIPKNKINLEQRRIAFAELSHCKSNLKVIDAANGIATLR